MAFRWVNDSSADNAAIAERIAVWKASVLLAFGWWGGVSLRGLIHARDDFRSLCQVHLQIAVGHFLFYIAFNAGH